MATLLGHTLGTPGLTPLAALDLFAESGLDGAELIWQDGYLGGIPESDDGRMVAEIKARAGRPRAAHRLPDAVRDPVEQP